MSFKLAEALNSGDLTIRNRSNGEVALSIPKPNEPTSVEIIPPYATINLTKKFAIVDLEKSPNLKKLVSMGVLDVL